MVERKWWTKDGGTVVVNSNGRAVVVKQLWWNSYGGTEMAER